MSKRRKSEADRFKGPAKWVQYVLARGLVTLLQYLPIRLSFKLGRGVGWLLWKFLKHRRATVRKNLEVVNAFAAQEQANTGGVGGQLSLHIDEQIREVFQRAGANLLSGFRFGRLRADQIKLHLEVTGVQHLSEALSQGRGAIVLLAHMGPWEALTQLQGFIAQRGIDAPLASMYRPLNNAYLDDWMRRQREALGTRLYSRRDGFHKPVDHLRGGGILGILADQKMREGPTAPYFGVAVSSSPIPGLMHRRSGAPMVALSVETVGLAAWRMVFRPVEVPLNADVASREQMAAITNQAIQASLSQSPLDGFWLHKRF